MTCSTLHSAKNKKTNLLNYLIVILCFIFVSSINAEELSDVNKPIDSTEIQYYDTFQLKTESHAFKSSLWGTLVPLPTIAFALPGFVLGPSLGYFYADMPGRAWRGIAIRSVGVIGMASAFAWSFSDFDFGENSSNNDGAAILFFTSAGVLVFSAVYDIATIRKAVRNKKASMLQTIFTIFPKYYAATESVGLSLNIRF